MNNQVPGVRKTWINRVAWTPLLLFTLSLAVRYFFIAAFKFDGLYGQDAFGYFNQATAIVDGLPQGQLPPLDFFWPNGYPLLIAAFMGLLGKTEWAALLPALLAGSSIAPLTYLICKELLGEEANRVGILAALIVSVAGQPILSSISSMADMPALFWAMLATWCLVQTWHLPGVSLKSQKLPQKSEIYKPSRGIWLALVGLLLGFAVITRWIYAALALPFAGYALYQTRILRSPIWLLALPVLAGLLVILPQVWLSTHRPEGLFHAWLMGWSPANFFANTFQTPDGRLTFERPVAFFNVLPAIHPAYLFPLLGLAIPVGLWSLWQEKAGGALILLAGWAGPLYLFLAGIPYENFRFGLSFYPPLVMLAGVGIVNSTKYALQWINRRTVDIGYWIWVGGSLVFMLGWAFQMVKPFLEIQNQSKAQVMNIAVQLPEHATVITLGPTLIFQHYTAVKVVELFFLDETQLINLVEVTKTIYLLIDIPDTEGRWKGMGPQIHYAWLKTHTSLVPLGEFSPYTLFEIQKSTSTIK